MSKKQRKVRAPDLDKYIKQKNIRKYVTYYEGAQLYNLCYSVFMRMAKAAGATYPIRKTAIIDLDKFDKYLEEQAAQKKEQQLQDEEAEKMVRREVENLQELVEAGAKRFIRIDEGAKLYSVGRASFRRMAEEADAIYKIGATLLINVPELEAYIEKQSISKQPKTKQSVSRRKKGY